MPIIISAHLLQDRSDLPNTCSRRRHVLICGLASRFQFPEFRRNSMLNSREFADPEEEFTRVFIIFCCSYSVLEIEGFTPLQFWTFCFWWRPDSSLPKLCCSKPNISFNCKPLLPLQRSRKSARSRCSRGKKVEQCPRCWLLKWKV